MSKEPSWIGPSKKKKKEEERKQKALEISNRIKEVAKTQKPILERGQRTAPKVEKPTTTSKNSRSNIITEQQKKTQQVATSRFQEEKKQKQITSDRIKKEEEQRKKEILAGKFILEEIESGEYSIEDYNESGLRSLARYMEENNLFSDQLDLDTAKNIKKDRNILKSIATTAPTTLRTIGQNIPLEALKIPVMGAEVASATKPSNIIADLIKGKGLSGITNRLESGKEIRDLLEESKFDAKNVLTEKKKQQTEELINKYGEDNVIKFGQILNDYSKEEIDAIRNKKYRTPREQVALDVHESFKGTELEKSIAAFTSAGLTSGGYGAIVGEISKATDGGERLKEVQAEKPLATLGGSLAGIMMPGPTQKALQLSNKAFGKPLSNVVSKKLGDSFLAKATARASEEFGEDFLLSPILSLSQGLAENKSGEEITKDIVKDFISGQPFNLLFGLGAVKGSAVVTKLGVEKAGKQLDKVLETIKKSDAEIKAKEIELNKAIKSNDDVLAKKLSDEIDNITVKQISDTQKATKITDDIYKKINKETGLEIPINNVEDGVRKATSEVISSKEPIRNLIKYSDKLNEALSDPDAKPFENLFKTDVKTVEDMINLKKMIEEQKQLMPLKLQFFADNTMKDLDEMIEKATQSFRSVIERGNFDETTKEMLKENAYKNLHEIIPNRQTLDDAMDMMSDDIKDEMLFAKDVISDLKDGKIPDAVTIARTKLLIDRVTASAKAAENSGDKALADKLYKQSVDLTQDIIVNSGTETARALQYRAALLSNINGSTGIYHAEKMLNKASEKLGIEKNAQEITKDMKKITTDARKRVAKEIDTESFMQKIAKKLEEQELEAKEKIKYNIMSKSNLELKELKKIDDKDKKFFSEVYKILDKKAEELIDNDVLKELKEERLLEKTSENKYFETIKYSLKHKSKINNIWGETKNNIKSELKKMLLDKTISQTEYDNRVRILSDYFAKSDGMPFADNLISKAIDKELSADGLSIKKISEGGIKVHEPINEMLSDLEEYFSGIPKSIKEEYLKKIKYEYYSKIKKYKKQKDDKLRNMLSDKVISKTDLSLPPIKKSDEKFVAQVLSTFNKKAEELINNDTLEILKAERRLEKSLQNKYLSDIRYSIQHKDEFLKVWKETKDVVKNKLDKLVADKVITQAEYDMRIGMLDEYFGEMGDIPFAKKMIEQATNKELANRNLTVSKIVRQGLEIDEPIETIVKRIEDEFGTLPENTRKEFIDLFKSEYYERIKSTQRQMLERYAAPKVGRKNSKTIVDKIMEYDKLGAFEPDNEQLLKEIAERTKTPFLTQLDKDTIRILADDYDNETDPTLKAIAFGKFMNYVKSKVPVTYAQELDAMYTTSVLANLKTFKTNILSNMAAAVGEELAMLNASVIESATQALKKSDVKTRTIAGTRDYKKAIKGAVERVKEDYKLFKQGIDIDYSNTKFGKIRGDEFMSRATDGNIKKAINALGRTVVGGLKLPDSFFKGLRENLVEQDIEKLSRRGFNSLSVEDVNKLKVEEAEYVTFQRNNVGMSVLLNNFRKALDRYLSPVGVIEDGFRIGWFLDITPRRDKKIKFLLHPENSNRFKEYPIEFGVGSLTQRFTTVAGNLASVATDYTPLGFLKIFFGSVLQGHAAKQLSTEAQQRQLMLSLGRAMAGTEVGLMGYWLSQAGILQLPEQDETKGRRAGIESTVGGTQYSPSLNIDQFYRLISDPKNTTVGDVRPDDSFIRLDFLETLNPVLELGARIQMSRQDGNVGEALKESGLDFMNNTILNNNYSNTVRTIVNEFNDNPDENMAIRMAELGINPYLGLPKSLIPKFIRDVAIATDPYKKDLTPKNQNLFLRSLEKSALQAGSSIPGIRSMLPDKYAGFGGKQLEYGYSGDENVLEKISRVSGNLSPTTNQTVVGIRNQKTLEFLDKIKEVSGATEQYPKLGPKTIDKVKLTPEQREKYMEAYNDSLNSEYRKIATNYSNVTKSNVENILKKLSSARSKAKKKAESSIEKELNKEK